MIAPVLDPARLYAVPCRHPWWTVGIAMLLAALGGLAYTGIEIVTDRRQLSNPELEINQLVARYREDFGDRDYLVLVVTDGSPEALETEDDAEGNGPSIERRAAMRAVAQGFAERLRERPDLFPTVMERVRPDRMGPLAFLYLPDEVFDPAVVALERARPMIERWAAAPGVASMLDAVDTGLVTLAEGSAADPAADGTPSEERAVLEQLLAVLTRFFEWFGDELARTDADEDRLDGFLSDSRDALGTARFDPEGYFLAADGKMLTALATVTADIGTPNPYARGIVEAKAALEEVLAEVGDPGIEAGLAGIPAVEYEEMITSQRDFARGAILALVLVSAFFMWSFGELRRPALAAFCLVLAIGMTFGFAWIAVGHLNLLAMVFTIVLVALGIDFAIHMTAHYERHLAEGTSRIDAIRYTYRDVAGALAMGGLTSSVAFLAARFTEAPGLSELGTIAGGGLLIALLCTVFVYPALLVLFDRGKVRGHAGESAYVSPTEGEIARRRPALLGSALLVVCVVISAAGFAAGQYRFDTNLLGIQPTQGDASRWQRALLVGDDRTRFALATYRDRSELERVRSRLEQRTDVIRATECVFPHHETRKREALAPICDALGSIRVGDPPPADSRSVRRELFSLRQSVRRLREATPEAETALAPLDNAIDTAYRALRELSADDAASRLTWLQQILNDRALPAFARLSELVCPPPFALDLAPTPLRERFVGASGKLALVVYPVEDTWEAEAGTVFANAVLAEEPGAFGGLVSFQWNARSMVTSFARASIYAAIAITILVFAWVRSVRRTLLCILPLSLSVGMLLFLMRFGPRPVEWNFANFFALPVLIGIGVDSGIHLVRAWEENRSEVFRGARRAVVISTVTTIIGFGILATSEHVGVRSLGLILLMGIFLVLFTSLAVLPIALRWFGAILFAVTLTGAASTDAIASGPAPEEGTAPSYAMIKPGDPSATPELAREFLDALSAWLAKNVPAFEGQSPVGHIANRRDAARELLKTDGLALVFAPAGFCIENLRTPESPALDPVAEIPRFERTFERYSIVTKRDGGAASLEALARMRVVTLGEPDRAYLRRVVFPADRDPNRYFRLEASENLADDVFLMVEGFEDENPPDALLLDEELRRFFEKDDLVWPELQVVWESGELPRDLVLPVGDGWDDASRNALEKALLAMGRDDGGTKILELMQSTGLAAPDRKRLKATIERFDAAARREENAEDAEKQEAEKEEAEKEEAEKGSGG